MNFLPESEELETLCCVAAMIRRDLVMVQSMTNGWTPLLLQLNKSLGETLVKIENLKKVKPPKSSRSVTWGWESI